MAIWSYIKIVVCDGWNNSWLYFVVTNFFSFRLFERHIKVRRKMSSECVAMQWHYSRHIHYLIIASNGTTACSKYINRLIKCVHSVSLWIGLFTAKCQFTSVALHSIFILMETLDAIRISYAPDYKRASEF